DTITYIINVSNLGNGTAYNVNVKDILPDGTKFDSSSSGYSGNCNNNHLSCSESPSESGNISCDVQGGGVPVGQLNTGCWAGARLKVKVLPTAGSNISNNTAFLNYTDNYIYVNDTENSSWSEICVNKPHIVLHKEPSQSPSSEPGHKFNYTITVKNEGTGTAYNVNVNDTIPDNCSFVSQQSTGNPTFSLSSIRDKAYWVYNNISSQDNTRTITLTIKCNSNASIVREQEFIIHLQMKQL
ncbi:MAG: hypothetical protein CVT88_02395, partial [Candidatus Altiarchaeales archaeon HGW-Altiarchaeales-1]